jgi:hypothetical protein
VSDRDAGNVGVRSQMDADAHSAATGAGTTTVTVGGGRWWGPSAATASASTDVVSLLVQPRAWGKYLQHLIFIAQKAIRI